MAKGLKDLRSKKATRKMARPAHDSKVKRGLAPAWRRKG
jgi:hypothetical protein